MPVASCNVNVNLNAHAIIQTHVHTIDHDNVTTSTSASIAFATTGIFFTNTAVNNVAITANMNTISTIFIFLKPSIPFSFQELCSIGYH